MVIRLLFIGVLCLSYQLESRMMNAEKRVHDVENRAQSEIEGAQKKYLAEKTSSAVGWHCLWSGQVDVL